MAHFCAPRSAPRDPRSEAELLRQLTSRGRRKARRLKEQRRSAAQVLWHKIIILYPEGACNFSEYLRKEKPWNTKEKLYKITDFASKGRAAPAAELARMPQVPESRTRSDKPHTRSRAPAHDWAGGGWVDSLLM